MWVGCFSRDKHWPVALLVCLFPCKIPSSFIQSFPSKHKNKNKQWHNSYLKNTSSTYVTEYQLFSHHSLQICLDPSPKVNPLLWLSSHLPWSALTTACGIIIIPKGMTFPRSKHPIRACIHWVPDWHALIKTESPSGNKSICHVIIPFSNHLTIFPETITVCRWIAIG